MLNQDTLLLVQVCVTLLTTVLLSVAAWYTDSPTEQRWWAAGNMVICCGVALTNLDALPPLVNSVLGYGVLGLGLGLVLRGLRTYCSEKLAWRWIGVMVLLATVGPAYFTWIDPSLRARLCYSGFYFAACTWLCAVTLARHGGWRGICISVVGFTVLGLALFMRGVHMLFHNDPADGASSLVMGITMLVVPLAQIAIAFGLILMVMWRYALRLRQLSTLDVLTGALNRAGLEVQGKRVALRAQRGGRAMAVIMIDVDHFKDINDTYGHPVGDEVLRHMALLLKDELRPQDLLTRLGGEEFVLVLDGSILADAINVAQRLRARIESELVETGDLSVRYTASLGVACSDQHGYDLIRLISAGDAAMYAAKRAGRNQVIAG